MDDNDDKSAQEPRIDDIIISYLSDCDVEDGNILGHFDDIEIFKIIIQKLKDNGYSFSVRNSDVRKKNPKSDSACDAETKVNAVFYHSKSTSIKFFGFPFTVEKTINYQCSYGFKYYKSKAQQQLAHGHALPVKKRQNVVSKKMGCLATMILKKVNVYPDYRLDDVKDWRKKKRLIESLRKDLNTIGKEVNKFSRYFISISIQSRHNHPPFLQNNLSPRKKRNSSEAAPNQEETKKTFDVDMDESKNWVTLYSVPQVIEHESDKDDVAIYESLVACNVQTVDLKLDGSGGERGGDDVVKTYHLETIQCPTVQDLQLLFKEKLKRLYSLSESCENTELFLRLLSNLEQVDTALVSDIGYDPTL